MNLCELMLPKWILVSSSLHICSFVMTEYQCMYIVITNPSLVVCACHQCLSLLHCANCECLIVDVFECAFDYSIFLILCIKYMLVQFDVFHTHSTTLNHHVTKNTLCSIVNHIFLINQTVHLGHKSYEPHDSITIMLILENGSR